MRATKKTGGPTDKAMTRPCRSSLAPSSASSVGSQGSTNGSKKRLSKKFVPSVIAANSAKISADKVIKRESPESCKTSKPKLKTKKFWNNGNDSGAAVKNEDDSNSNKKTKKPAQKVTQKSTTQKSNNGKKIKTVHRNGRVVGRKLVMWHRPRMMEKLLLHVQYECHRAQIQIPWDRAVERLSPESSGITALQCLNKLRDVLVSEGHMVPPLLGKKSVKQDPTVRGYILDMRAARADTTRVVRWGEHIEDRKENLPTPGIVRGSGNYRRGVPKVEKQPKGVNGRRNRLPAELRKVRKGRKSSVGAKSEASSERSLSHSPDPAELAADKEYNPNARKQKPRLCKVLKQTHKGREVLSSTPSEIDGKTNSGALQGPHMMCFNASEAGHSAQSPSLTIKLVLDPQLLAKFPPGESNKMDNSEEEDCDINGEDFESDNLQDQGSDELQFAQEAEKDLTNESNADAEFEYANDTNVNDPVNQYVAAPSNIPAVNSYTASLSYQGIEKHGTLEQYIQAIACSIDPCVNGLAVKRAKANGESHANSIGSASTPHGYAANMDFNASAATSSVATDSDETNSAATNSDSDLDLQFQSPAFGNYDTSGSNISNDILNFESPHNDHEAQEPSLFNPFAERYPPYPDREQIENIMFDSSYRMATSNDGYNAASTSNGMPFFQCGSGRFRSTAGMVRIQYPRFVHPGQLHRSGTGFYASNTYTNSAMSGGVAVNDAENVPPPGDASPAYPEPGHYADYILDEDEGWMNS